MCKARFSTFDRSMHYERAPVLQEEGWVAGAACGGFAPAPPGFNALVPLPIGSFCKQMAKGGCRSIPLHRSRPLSRRSGCFPALALSSAQSEPDFTAAVNELQLCAVSSERITLTLRESGPAEDLPSPPRRYAACRVAMSSISA